MSSNFSFGKIDVNLTASAGQAEGAPTRNTPFHILILGDLSGRSSRGVCETASSIGSRKIYPIDRDNVDEVIQSLKVELQLPVGTSGQTMSISFASLDDFHPDHLFDRLEVFAQLRQMRRRLSNSATFTEAASEMQGWAHAKPSAPAPTPAVSLPSMPAVAPGDNLLDLVLGGGPGEGAPIASAPASGNDWSAVIREIVGPHVVAAPSAKQAELLAQVDEATSAQMRSILHAPAFQALEATWRGLDFLVRRVETEENLNIFVVDLSKEELFSDLRAQENLAATGIYHLLVDRTVGTPGANRWALLTGAYAFEATVDAIDVLGRMSRIAALANAPFVSGATPRFLGVEKIEESPDPDDWTGTLAPDVAAAWSALRSLPETRGLALALPRFLTRLPYGKKSNPTEHFAFEEMPKGSVHGEYAWASSSLLVAAAIARGFEKLGWELKLSGAIDLDGLPMHVYKDDGESVVKPCAEVLLVERAADRITELGFVPIQSFKGGDTVRVRGIISVAKPTRPLIGRWSK